MSRSTDSKVIESFLYDNHIYHWVAIEGRNCRGYHLGIPQSCNRISSFASSNNSHESMNEKTNIHHSLIRTLRDTTKYEIIVSAFNKFVKNPNYNSKIRQSSEIEEIDRVESNNGNENEDKNTNIEEETEMKKSKEIGNEYCKATHDGSDTITTENNEIIEEQTEKKEFESKEKNDCNELTECNAESTQNNETQTCENTNCNEKNNEPRYIEVPKYNWQCQCALCHKITINDSECKSHKNKNKNKNRNKNKNKNKNKNGKNKYRVCGYQHSSDVYEIDSMKEESNESNLTSNSITNNNDNGDNRNRNINRSMKHGLVIAFTGHGNKNGDMCIGATKITPTLSEQKQFKKLRKKYEKENLGFGFADLFENTNEFEDYKGIWDETNQLISLQGLIYNMIEIINQHSLYYNINIDHLLILNDGCHSGNWCYKLKSVLNDNSINKIIGNINVTIVASCEKNNLAYELQSNPNDGGRFYKLLLGNKDSTYKHDCKLNENCKFCESIKHKRKKTHKQYYKHKNKCDEFNNEVIIANHNNMLIKWSNEKQKMIVIQSKFQ